MRDLNPLQGRRSTCEPWHFFGLARPSANPVYIGLIPSRTKDELGIGSMRA
jgi:hypothetical protein